jgi:hypothetical protein
VFVGCLQLNVAAAAAAAISDGDDVNNLWGPCTSDAMM